MLWTMLRSSGPEPRKETHRPVAAWGKMGKKKSPSQGEIWSHLLREILEMQSLGTAKTKLNTNNRKHTEVSITCTAFGSCVEPVNQISAVRFFVVAG